MLGCQDNSIELKFSYFQQVVAEQQDIHKWKNKGETLPNTKQKLIQNGPKFIRKSHKIQHQTNKWPNLKNG